MNFTYLNELENFKQLSRFCQDAENLVYSNTSLSATSSRKALESIVKSFYVAKYGEYSKGDTLFELIEDEHFSYYLDNSMLSTVHYVRKIGNNAVHGEIITKKQSLTCLMSLYYSVGQLLSLMGVIKNYPEFDKTLYDKKLLNFPLTTASETEVKVDENVKSYKENITKNLKITSPLNISEAQTRKLYIDESLKEAGWSICPTNGTVRSGMACVEIKVFGMPNQEGTGYVDYVLYDDDLMPLAIIEAKKTSVDPISGSQQAKLYADCLEKQFGTRPVIFYTNGFEYYVVDGTGGPSRKVYGFYSKKELHSIIVRRSIMDISNTNINSFISDRYFIQEAATNVCEAFNKKKRKALIVMATGTGKTRCAISIVDLLQKANWVKRVLFLADRTALVNQAKNAFLKYLPHSTLSVLSDRSSETNYEAKVILSTYQTIINMIDCEEKQFGIGAFDLIIIDECHRSIYNKYKAIFTYFDSLILGLTATPREQIDNSTYDIFNLPNGEPTYSYDYKEAVKEGYLVDFYPFERTTKLLKNGLKYDELSDEEKEQYENLFSDQDGNFPKELSGKMFYEQIMNIDTIDLVIKTVMTEGLRVDSGERLGKTIIFAVNHFHAKAICDRFKVLYPEKGDNYCKLIDHTINYAQSLIDSFSIKDAEPIIAVSVDMLDSGIDIPEILNLVFFKRIYSKIKFWQMIGRGTRVCRDLYVLSPSSKLFGGQSTLDEIKIANYKDKQGFYIFDFCNVFEFFRINPDGKKAATTLNLTQKIFNLKLDIIYELQKYDYQENKEYVNFYQNYKNELVNLVKKLNRELIQVKTNIRYVEKYSYNESWNSLSTINIKEIHENITPLIDPMGDNESSKYFDLWIFNMEFYEILGNVDYSKGIQKIRDICYALLDKLTIPDVAKKKEFIKECLVNEFWEAVTLTKLEKVRNELRDLIKFLSIPKGNGFIESMFHDEIIYKLGGEPIKPNFKNYKEKVIDYLYENSEYGVIAKIKRLEPINYSDLKELEDLLCNRLGTKNDFEKEAKGLSVPVYVRQLIGFDNDAINQKLTFWFSEYNFNSKQQEFIREIVNFVRQNGDIEFHNLSEDNPFKHIDYTEIFDKTEPLYKIISFIHAATTPNISAA